MASKHTSDIFKTAGKDGIHYTWDCTSCSLIGFEKEYDDAIQQALDHYHSTDWDKLEGKSD